MSAYLYVVDLICNIMVDQQICCTPKKVLLMLEVHKIRESEDKISMQGCAQVLNSGGYIRRET